MPSKRELGWTHTKLEGSIDAYIEPMDEEPVYYTDQEPNFEITIENNTQYDFRESSVIKCILAIGQGRPAPFITKTFANFDISAGESRTIEVFDEPLSLEGHGIIALGGGSIPRVDDEEKTMRFTATSFTKEKYEPLATFSVWDREHYEILHENPQRAQQFSLFASVGIVFFAVIQSGSILGFPKLGLLGGIAILIVYWRSGFLGELMSTLSESK